MKTSIHSVKRWLAVLSMVAILLLFAAPAGAFGQGYGAIRGTVVDSSGALIPSATVTVTQTGTGRKTSISADQSGAFIFPSLPPAEYSLSVSASGFGNYERAGVNLQADQSLSLRISLELGTSTQTISVSGDAPQIDTVTGTLSQVVDQKRINDLPLNGRNAAVLSTLVAGILSSPPASTDQGSTKAIPAEAYISANGSRPEQNNFLLNGGNNVDEMNNVNAPYPFPDALQEFSVQTSNYSAQYGQNSGAVVNIVTKSGGGQFHGDLFEYLRNGYFNAKPFFANKADALHRHQFGGTIGGPVIIPHLSTGKTTQFFFGYQHTLLHQLSSSSTATVPTASEEAIGQGYADFGSLCSAGFNSSNLCTNANQQIINPFNQVSYPLNRIPTNALDPSALAILAHIPTFSGTPAAGKVGGLINYNVPTTQSFDEYIAGSITHSAIATICLAITIRISSRIRVCTIRIIYWRTPASAIFVIRMSYLLKPTPSQVMC